MSIQIRDQLCDHDRMARERSYTAVVAKDRRGRVLVPVPFDPDAVWGQKTQHRVHGTVNGMGVRAIIEPLDTERGILLGPAWRRDCGIAPGDKVQVVLTPEGPQREDLAPDVAAALEAEPDAAAFFDSLAQFYRRGYLRWIDATKRRPDVRAGADRRDGPAVPGGDQGVRPGTTFRRAGSQAEGLSPRLREWLGDRRPVTGKTKRFVPLPRSDAVSISNLH